MGSNIEIKARLSPADVKRVRAEALNRSTGPSEALEQVDTFYRAPSGRLKLRRIADGYAERAGGDDTRAGGRADERGGSRAELIAYDRPDQAGPKRSSYSLLPCRNPDDVHATMARRHGVRGVVEKRRLVIHVGQTRVHLDEVAGLGNFLELEVVLREDQTPHEGEAIAAELMEAFGIAADSLVEGAYIDLLEKRAVRQPARVPAPEPTPESAPELRPERTPGLAAEAASRPIASLLRRTFLTLGGIFLLSSSAAAWDGAAWADYSAFIRPMTDEIRANLVQIRLAGEAQGREPGRLGQIGDSITETSAYFRNVALNGPSGNATGHDYDPVRSWLAYNGTAPADANSFYRDHGKGPAYGNLSGWCLPEAVAAGHPPQGVNVGDGATPGNYSWVLVMFGTNDIDDAGWAAAPWKEELRAFVQGYVDLGVVPVLSTIPPEAAHVGDGRVLAANTAIRELATEMVLLHVDYYELILFYQPVNWHGTLISADGTHPSAGGGGADFSQDGLTTTDGYAARTKLTLDVAEVLQAEVFAFDPTGVEPGVSTKTWGGLKGGFRR